MGQSRSRAGYVSRRKGEARAAALLASAVVAGPGSAAEKKTLALVTNAAADFWTIARRGTEKARAELPSYNIEMYVVSEATAAAQRQVLDNLLTNGVAGVSISAIDPANPTEILNKVASQAVLFMSLRGGEGSILGIVVRAILLQVPQNLVNLLGVPADQQL